MEGGKRASPRPTLVYLPDPPAVGPAPPLLPPQSFYEWNLDAINHS